MLEDSNSDDDDFPGKLFDLCEKEEAEYREVFFRPTSGLVNENMTSCFVSCVLQALAATPGVKAALATRSLTKKELSTPHGRLFRAVTDLVSNLWTDTPVNATLSPAAVRCASSVPFNNFAQQHDAMEFFNDLVDSLESSDRTKHSGFWANTMLGHTRTTTTCLNCQNITNRDEKKNNCRASSLGSTFAFFRSCIIIVYVFLHIS